VGRPRRVFDRERVAALRAHGLSDRRIASRLGLGDGTVRRVLRAQKARTEPRQTLQSRFYGQAPIYRTSRLPGRPAKSPRLWRKTETTNPRRNPPRHPQGTGHPRPQTRPRPIAPCSPPISSTGNVWASFLRPCSHPNHDGGEGQGGLTRRPRFGCRNSSSASTPAKSPLSTGHGCTPW
jgi:hypothetical protein